MSLVPNKSSYRESDIPPLGAMPDEDDDGAMMEFEFVLPEDPNFYMQDGIKVTELDDDMVELDMNPNAKPSLFADLLEYDHDENLAERLDDTELAIIATDLIEGVEYDLSSRSDWEQTITQGMDRMGLKLTNMGAESADGTISKVHHPLLLESVVNYQSEAGGELYPAGGPVKVEDNSISETGKRSEMADAMERDFNYYLTDVAKEYYPAGYKKLWFQGFMGNAFRKVYHHPLRRRPVSDFVSALDLIVSNDVASLEDANRVTHRVKMRQNVMKRMMLLGVYREIDLDLPSPSLTTGDQKKAEIEGIAPAENSNLSQDLPHEVYEIYTELDLKGYEHKDEDGEPTGLPLPYRVTIETTSRKILEIRRNWKEGDPNCEARSIFVHYPFVPGFGFYAYGIVHLIGQNQQALTAIERELIDAGMFANFPGFLTAKQGLSQGRTNQIRPMPGTGAEVDTGGMPIKESVMELPYRDNSAGLLNLAGVITDMARKVVGAAVIPVGEGTSQTPVGTILAMIEQATKPMAAIHKRNHNAQQREFQLLKDLFIEDPQALFRFTKQPERSPETYAYLKDALFVPASDPNTPSNTHRIIRAWALVEMAKADQEGLFNKRAVYKRAIASLGISDTDIMNPEPPPGAAPPAPPTKLDEIKAEAAAREAEQTRELQQDIVREKLNENQQDKDLAMKAAELEDREKERISRERVAALNHDKDTKKENTKVIGDLAGKAMDHKAADKAQKAEAKKPTAKPKAKK